MTDPQPHPRPQHYDEPDVLTADELQAIEEKFDPELRFRTCLLYTSPSPRD